MGTTYGQTAGMSGTDYVVDFAFNAMKPTNRHILTNNGPSMNNMPENARTQVFNDMNEIILTCCPQAANAYQTMQYISYGLFAGTFIGIILCIVMFSTVGAAGFAPFLVIAIGCAVGSFVVQCKMRQQGLVWREQLAQAMKAKLPDWKAMTPAFTFTIIYPICQYRRTKNGRKLVAVWMHIRVTQGVVQGTLTDPIYAYTQQTQTMVQQPVQVVYAQQPVQQPQVVMAANGQATQVVYAQPQTAVMPNANGQPVQVVYVQQAPTQAPVVQGQTQIIYQNGPAPVQPTGQTQVIYQNDAPPQYQAADDAPPQYQPEPASAPTDDADAPPNSSGFL